MIFLFSPSQVFVSGLCLFVRFHSNRNHSCECWSNSQRKVKFSDLSADRNVTGQIPNCWGCWLRYLAGRKCFKCHLESEVCGWINRSNMTHIYASLVQSHSLNEFGQNSFTSVYSWFCIVLNRHLGSIFDGQFLNEYKREEKSAHWNMFNNFLYSRLTVIEANFV